MSWLWRFLQRIVPFGILTRNKPRHFREMLRVLWENRGRWAYAFRILNHGVCDGCSLGTTGLRDDVLPGLHLCLTRLKLLRLNTMGPIPESVLEQPLPPGAYTNEQLHHLGRVPYPLLKNAGQDHFERISWEQASETVAAALVEADPDRVGFFLTSRGLTNETYYMVQKLARIAGTPHIDSCARLCHAASGVGLKQTIGYGAPTISLIDIVQADVVFVIGSNLPNNQPVSTKYLRAARKRGARVIVLNPFKEPALERYWIPSVPTSALFGTKLMDDYYAVRPGGDIALINGLLKALDQLAAFDERFIADHTQGFEELRANVRRLSWAELVSDAGVSQIEIEHLAGVYAAANRVVFIYSMGLTQYTFGVENVKSVVNLALARGMIGREGCGILPIRGHSGVQGTAECGADADKLPGAQDITDDNCDRFEKFYGHPIPRRRGMHAAHLLDKAAESGLDVLYLVGGNHLETMPDRKNARRGLENVKLRIHQDIVLNSSTLLPARGAVLVLPAQTRYEQKSGGTSTSTERRIRYTPEIPGPRIEEARPEWEIPALIGQKLKPERTDLFHYDSSSAIRAEMADMMPIYQGIQHLEREGDQMQWGGPRLCAGGFPNMPDGKARFSVVQLPRVDVPLGRFMLTSRRGKQFNSITYGDTDPLTRGARRGAILLDPRDLSALDLQEGAKVLVSSDHGEMEATVKAGPCRTRHVQAFWPECNVLLKPVYDPQSGEPEYGTVVKIQPRAATR
jgi:molybdopterin-dependent oxidoreductase alpha subunit